MSQQMPQQIPQQMPVVYPVTGTVPTSSSSSNGSYGAVFIVLAVIVTISAFACFLGRLCNKSQNVAKPSRQSLPTKEKDAKGNVNGFQTKDGDLEFGYDKRFASAKVAKKNEPINARPDSFGKPNVAQSNSFHEPTSTGRPNSMHEPRVGQSGSFHKQNKVQPSWSPEPAAIERPNSFQEPTMGQSYSLHKDEPQGDQVRFGADRDNNQINFKIRTRPQRY